MQSNSYLGEPLNAEIELVSVDGSIDLTTIIVRQVPVEEASAMGVDLSYTPYKFNLSVDSRSGAPKVMLVSGESIKEPYLNLLIELRWPSGVVYREYPILLDPLPTVSVAAAVPRPRQDQESDKYIPVISTRPDNAQALAAPTELSPLSANNGNYVVQSGDSLSKIAQNWSKGSKVSANEIMRWLHENNPEAFARGNINQLRAGATLQMPDLSAFLSPGEQRALQTLITERDPSSKEDDLADAAMSPDLIARDSAAREPSQNTGTEEPGGLLTVSATTRDDKTREMIDLLVRENESLRERVEKLEQSEYLDTLKQLIVLQRQQISDLRSKLGDDEASVTAEMDALLAQIGVSKPSDGEVSADKPMNSADVQPATNQLETEVAADPRKVDEVALLNLEADVKPAVPSPVGQKRDWFLWIVIGSGIFLIGLFAALYRYYRRLVPVKQVEEEYVEILESMDEGDGKGRTYYDSDALDEPKEFVLFDDTAASEVQPEPQNQVVSQQPVHRDDRWMGEKAQSTDYQELNSVIEDVQKSFELASLDEGALDNLDNINEHSLEGLTNEMPKDSGKTKSGAESKSKERRPDDEVRMSIAEKMSQYNPEEYRNELESLGFLELDELVEVDDSDEDEIDAIVYRAKMFCEFKKYDKAIELIASKMDIIKDSRLSDAMDEICTLRDANNTNKKVS